PYPIAFLDVLQLYHSGYDLHLNLFPGLVIIIVPSPRCFMASLSPAFSSSLTLISEGEESCHGHPSQ
ncbi:MAG: hypothetical protein LUQ44_02140, partial [Methanothrix sp.]|nr:hypothetical protein [Methanothrix sp.]